MGRGLKGKDGGHRGPQPYRDGHPSSSSHPASKAATGVIVNDSTSYQAITKSQVSFIQSGFLKPHNLLGVLHSILQLERLRHGERSSHPSSGSLPEESPSPAFRHGLPEASLCSPRPLPPPRPPSRFLQAQPPLPP